ncbi:MAG: hypothetical protein EOP82_16175 [Variovorax sp.]|nr:MAG: hypothetical protein EOP82_16175 [Variovorax sp.]
MAPRGVQRRAWPAHGAARGGAQRGKATGATPGLVVAAILALSPAQAQIAGDRTAPGHLRPTVLVAPNGVPLINIQTPSAAGTVRVQNVAGQWIDKKARSTFFPQSWSEARLSFELADAFSKWPHETTGAFIATTPSGVKVQFLPPVGPITSGVAFQSDNEAPNARSVSSRS